MKLLTDNNISPKVARAINELIKDGRGSVAIALRDKFSPNTPDLEWIDRLGQEGGWSVISADLRITKNKAERAAWMQTDLVGFFMEPGLAKLNPIEQTARLLMRLPMLEDQLRLISGPALFALPIRATSRLKQLR